MNNRRAIAVAALVVVAIGFIVVLTLRAFTARQDRSAPPEPPVAAAIPAPAESGGTADPAPASEPPPPWLRNGTSEHGEADAAVAGAASDAAAEALRDKQMRRLRESMLGVIAATSAQSAATDQHLRDALDTLQAMNDPAVTSQINLEAVRHNLEISIRMRTLARQLQRIAAEPDSPGRQQRLDATSAELRGLASQLRQDVRAPGSTLPEDFGVPAAAR